MKPQINALTSTRAFAAIMVLIFHFGRSISPFDKFPSLFYKGNVAVSYFFVLSGFVLYISYAGSNIQYWDFLKKRMARIAPVYLFALLITVYIYLFLSRKPPTLEFGRQLILCILFIQAYFRRYALCLNGAAWSISVEMLFYVSFPFLMQLLKKKSTLFLILTVLAYAATQIGMYRLFIPNYAGNDNYNCFIYNPFFHLNEFMIGMVGAYLYKTNKRALKKVSLLPFFLFCLIVLLIAIKNDNVYFDTGLMAPLFILFIISTANYNPIFLNLKPLVFLGEISYGIYILQFPVQELSSSLNHDHLFLSEQISFFIFLGIILLTATYFFIEQPLRKKINSIKLGTK